MTFLNPYWHCKNYSLSRTMSYLRTVAFYKSQISVELNIKSHMVLSYDFKSQSPLLQFFLLFIKYTQSYCTSLPIHFLTINTRAHCTGAYNIRIRCNTVMDSKRTVPPSVFTVAQIFKL